MQWLIVENNLVLLQESDLTPFSCENLEAENSSFYTWVAYLQVAE